MASTTLPDGDGYNWDLYDRTSFGTTVLNGTRDAFDGGLTLSVNGVIFSGSFESSELGGRQAVVGGAVGDLAVQRRMYVPEVSGEGWARFFESFTNTGTSAQTVAMKIQSNSGNDSGFTVLSTSSGDTSFGTNDHWIVNDDGQNAGDPTVLHLFGDGTANPTSVGTTVFSAFGNQGPTYTFTLTVQPGETVSFLHFASQQTNLANIQSELATLQDPDATALFGLTPVQLGQVVNFDFNTPPLVSTADEDATGTEDIAVHGTLQPGTDADSTDTLTFVAGTTAVGGTVVIDGESGDYIFTPDENFNGTASFSYAVSDGEARSAEKIIEIDIAAVNDAPTNIGLSNAIVAESARGAPIGTLTTTDVDLTREGDSHTYAITGVTDASGNVLATSDLFDIDGDALKLKDGVALDFETNPSYRVEVTTTDEGGASYAKTFDLTVEDRPFGPDWSAGFEATTINDWYNPSWGGGFNASICYTVQEEDLVGSDVYAWDIAPEYSGSGTLVNAWMSGFNATVSTGVDESGEFVLSTDGQAFQRKLVAGDVLKFTVQVQGAGYGEDEFAFSFADVDQVPSASNQMLEIDAALTNSWGSGLSQNVAVRNIGGESVDDWTIELDVPDDIVFNLTSVWGATAAKDSDGDIVFEALGWNSSIGAGGAANFGFNASHDGGLAFAFEDSDFVFV